MARKGRKAEPKRKVPYKSKKKNKVTYAHEDVDWSVYPQKKVINMKRIRSMLFNNSNESEIEFYKKLRELDIPFIPQFPIVTCVETMMFVDCIIDGTNIVIELDGACHELTHVKKRDELRDVILNSSGYRVLRVKTTDSFDEVIMKLNKMIDAYRDIT